MIVKRIEIWDELECNSGAHKANIPQADLFKADLREKVDGEADLSIEIARESTAWTEIEELRILRVVYHDDSVQEYRITKPVESRGRRGEKTAQVQAESILMDLNTQGIVQRVEADGTVTLLYTYLSQTRDDLVDHILADLPAHYAKGTIDDATTVVPTFTFDHDTPLKALRELAEVEDRELAIRRNGSTDYKIDLLDQLGSAATTPEFRFAKNLLGIKREIDATEVGNRIYPGGGSDGAIRLHVGKSRWEVTNVAGLVVTLGGNPIYQDNHLIGFYVETPDGSKWQIDDSDYTAQTVTLATGHTAQVGDLIWFRELDGSIYRELAFVEDHVSQQTYGVMNMATEESDIPYVNNLAPNSAFREWDTTDVPTDWEEHPSVTSQSSGYDMTQNTLAEYTKVGGASVKIVANAADEGIKCTTAITIDPSEPMIYFSGFADVWVESGAVEFYWEHDEEGRFPEQGHKEAAYTTTTDSFIRLSIQGKEYPTSVSSGFSNEVTLYVVAKDGPATFYVDGIQFTNTAGNYDFFEENAACELWRRAFLTLDDFSLPKISYGIDVMDLTALDDTTWPYDAITLGGDVYVQDEELDISTTVRCLGANRDLMTGHNIRLELSNRPDDIIDILTKQKRRTAVRPEPREAVSLISFFDARLTADSTIVIKMIGNGSTRSYRYSVSISSMPTIAYVIASGTVSNEVTGTEVTTSTQLDYGQRGFVRIVAFPLLDGTGIAGETSTDLVGPPVYWNPTIDSSVATQTGDGGDSGGAGVKRTFTVTSRQTSAIRLFRRESGSLSPGAYPTDTGAYDGALDYSYDRGTINQADGWAYTDGGYVTDDVVWDIGIPIDHHGLEYDDPAYRVYGNHEVTGTTGGGAGDPYIVSMLVKRTQAGTDCDIGNRMQFYVSWTSEDWTTGTHEAILEQQLGAGGSWEDITPTGGYDPTDSQTAIEVPYILKKPGENVTIGYRVKVRLATSPFTVYDTETKYAGPYETWVCPI
jgi:hypothetical protein